MYTKYDHTQFVLLASANDTNGIRSRLNYVGFASGNDKPAESFFNCNFKPFYLDVSAAKRFAHVGHPLLLSDPDFDLPIDKRNCKNL